MTKSHQNAEDAASAGGHVKPSVGARIQQTPTSQSNQNIARFNEARNLLKEIQVSANHANHLLAKGELGLARTYINGIHKRDQKLQDEIQRLRGESG